MLFVLFIWLSWHQAAGLYEQRTPIGDGSFMLTVCAPSDVGRTLTLVLERPQGGTKVFDPWLVPAHGLPCSSWQVYEPITSTLTRRNDTVWLPLIGDRDTRVWLPFL